MKKDVFLFVFALFFLLSCSGDSEKVPPNVAQAGDSTANIEIVIDGFAGGKVMLYRQYGQYMANDKMDSLEVAAGSSMTFRKDRPYPSGMYYLVMPDRSFIAFILEKDQNMKLRTSISDLTGNMVISDCIDNELYYKDVAFETVYRPRAEALLEARNLLPGGSTEWNVKNDEYNQFVAERKAHIAWFSENHPKSFFTQFKIAGQNPDVVQKFKADGSIDTLAQVSQYRRDFFNNTKINDERLLYTPVTGNKVRKYLDELIPFDTDSAIACINDLIARTSGSRECFKYVLNQCALKFKEPTFIGGDSVFVYIIDNYFTAQKAWWETPESLERIQKLAAEMRPSLVGKTAQDLRCRSVTGASESLFDLKSRIIALYIYSVECDHCRERTPSLVKVFSEWKSRGLDVFALCIEKDESKWKGFVKQYGMGGMHNVFDPAYESQYYRKYHIDNTPELYIIDASRKIIARDLHPGDLPKILVKYL